MEQPVPAKPADAPAVGPTVIYADGHRKGVFHAVGRLFAAAIILLTIFGLGTYVGGIIASSVLTGPVKVTTYRPGQGKAQVMILPIEGLTDSTQAEFVRRCVDHLIRRYEKDQVKAVVLWVDSPGGPVTPADEIHHHLLRLKEQTGLPLIASYGSVAASGGYYVSCLADRIFAQPTTVTGSVGVIANVMTFGGTLEKLGIDGQTRTATTSPDKERANTLTRKWDEQDWAVLQPMLDRMHARFRQVVREGRAKVLDSDEKLQAVTTGLAYLGPQAKQLGLVDQIGYLDDALAAARKAAGLPDDAPVRMYQAGASLMSRLLYGTGRDDRPLALNARMLRRAMTELSVPRMMYLYQP